MPLPPMQRSSFKTSPRSAQSNLELHPTAPSPQQRAFLCPRLKLKKTSQVNLTMVDTNNLTMVKFTHRSSNHIAPKPHQHRATPSTQARSWHQGSAAEVADAMGATASTGSGPVFQKSYAHVVRSTYAERPRAPSHQRARPLLCAASLPYPAAKVRTRSKG